MEDLIKITLGEKSADLIKQIKKLSPDAGRQLQKIAFNAVDQAGDLAVSAVRSSVPVDSGELRNSIVTKTQPSLSAELPQSTIFIAQVTHLGRDNKGIDAGLLADILNAGRGKGGRPMKRSQPSHAEDGFPSYIGYTKDWLPKAENNFLKRLPTLLRRNFNN